MVHAHDNHGVTDEHLAPGAGFIEWNRVLMKLGEAGFHGGIILELSHMKDMQRLLQESRKAKRFLREIDRHPIPTLSLQHRTARDPSAKDE